MDVVLGPDGGEPRSVRASCPDCRDYSYPILVHGRFSVGYPEGVSPSRLEETYALTTIHTKKVSS